MLILDVLLSLTIWPAIVVAAIFWYGLSSETGIIYLIGLYPAINLVVLYAFGMYRRDSLSAVRNSLGRIPFVAATSAAGGVVLTSIMDQILYPEINLLPSRVWTVPAAFLCFCFGGMAGRVCLRLLRHYGLVRRRLLVVGGGARAWDLAWMLKAEGRNLQYEVIFAHAPAFGDIDPRLADGSAGRIVLLPTLELLKTALDHQIDQIVVAPDDRRGMTLMDLLACKTAGFPVVEYLTFFEEETHRIDLKRMEISWLLYSGGFYFGIVDRVLKRIFDIVVAAILMLVTMPLMLLGAVAIKLEDGGPALYRQARVTRGNREFGIYKLRTMTVNAEAAGVVWAAAKDSRVTRVGRFLRRTRMDELPQLFNVFLGDMSLVGPRPERPAFVSLLTDEIPLYGERHLVKAGLTGWAQINYPYGASINDARSKLSYDLYYVKNSNVLFDILIVLQTCRVVLWPGSSVR